MEKVFAKVDLGQYAPSSITSFGQLTTIIVGNAFVLAGLISFVLLVFGGFRVIISAGSGDSKSLEQGKQTITYAVVGLILVVASYWIVQLIGDLTGVPLLNVPGA